MSATGPGVWGRRAGGHRGGEPSGSEPFFWWGPFWSHQPSLSLNELIAAETISPEGAAMLALLIERRASCIVAAGPSGAGKTTFLTALLEALPADTRRVYLRGCYEPFDFIADADASRTALLVNEISPHLPVYLWGPAARRVFDLIHEGGYQLLATAHAESVPDLVYQLAAYPLRVPLEAIAAVRLFVFLDAWYDGGLVRRQVREIAWLRWDGEQGEGIVSQALATRPRRGAQLELDIQAAAALDAELGERSVPFERALAERAASLVSPA